MTKYICTGECGGVSDQPGVCQDPKCSKHGQSLVAQEVAPETESSDVEFEQTEEGEGEQNLVAKIKQLRDKLKVCQKERQEFLETSQRLKADYINLRKDEEKRRVEMAAFAKTGLLAELLDLADSFELAFANKKAWEEVNQNWRRGVEYIYGKLTEIFKAHGLAQIDPLGQPFDPEQQHSVGALDTNQKGEDNMVLEVVQKGYQLAGRVLRPAKVKVGRLV